MATHRISTPIPGVSGAFGKVGAVEFVDGHADIDETEHAAELRYFRDAGYLIEPIGQTEPDDEPIVEADVDGDDVIEALPKKSASAEVWRAFAVAHDMDQTEADGLSRDALVAHYTSKETGE